MKSIFETCVITIGMVFSLWIIVSAGMKFEVKIKGKEYGFTVGGMDANEKREKVFDSLYWSHAENGYGGIIFTVEELQRIQPRVFEDFIHSMFPLVYKITTYQYGKLAYVKMIPCDYPFHPVYTYLPKISLSSVYSIVN